MSRSDHQIYIPDDVSSLKKLLAEELPLLHSLILIQDYIIRVADRLQSAIDNRNPILSVLLRNHYTRFSFESLEDIWNQSHQIDLQELSARMHGFNEFSDIDSVSYIDPELQMGIDHFLNSPIEIFQDYIINHQSILDKQTAFGHQASLIHYIGSNGVEIYRQQVPLDIVIRVSILKDLNASFDISHKIYGGHCSLIDLIETSAHPKDAGVRKQLMKIIA